jgi:hypothetical protein
MGFWWGGVRGILNFSRLLRFDVLILLGSRILSEFLGSLILI